MSKVKQIVLKERGATIHVAGFGPITGAVDKKLHDAVVAAHPSLADKFEEVDVENQEIKVAEKVAEKKSEK
jgi:hypothetical protein